LISNPLPEFRTLWTSTITANGGKSFVVAVGATLCLPSSFCGRQLDLHFNFNASAAAAAARTFGVRVLAPPASAQEEHEAKQQGTETSAASKPRGVNVTVSTQPGSAFATLGGGAVGADRHSPQSPFSRTKFRVPATGALELLISDVNSLFPEVNPGG